MTDYVLKIVLIVAVVFLLLFAGLGFYYFQQIGTRQKPGSLEAQVHELQQNIGSDEKIESLKGQIAKLEKDIEEKDAEIVVVKWDTQLIKYDAGYAKPDGTVEPGRLRTALASFKTIKVIREAHHTKLGEARRKVAEYLERGDSSDPDAPCLQASRREKDKLEGQYTERRNALQAISDDITKDLTKEKLRYDRQHEDKRNERSRLETEYVQIREELQRYMVREDPEVDKSYDAVAITVDIETRQVVINIGTRQGVRPNMRFRVFQLRQGGRRIVKGFIVVRSVERETASCIIMNKVIRLPRCPADGYTARYAEERFCPFHPGSGGAGARIQRLKAIPQEVSMGMKVEDPIVVGDLVKNPFFEPNKRLHFAVKGDPDNRVAKDYGLEDFVAAIRWHGGVIDAELTAQTDVLLTGKYALEEERKARELGVKILRQYETFGFLRK